MAKESMKAREVKRAKCVERYAEKRSEIKSMGTMKVFRNYQKNFLLLEYNRCKITGRPKGYMRQFGISRVKFREMANFGLIPGVKKASW